jgi:hypothetical protein
MTSDFFSSQFLQNKPVPAAQLLDVLHARHLKVRPNDFMNFLLAQTASIAAEKRKLKEAKQK